MPQNTTRRHCRARRVSGSFGFGAGPEQEESDALAAQAAAVSGAAGWFGS
ncbi:hypothetical protein Q5H92_16990 [Hymenobacter sp. M29]|uniref:Uncharacterized protein n=1 Tax=Hymenobacter mellowenesis TaxID=3063995 RepID=A0ABT9AE16_9BACT|nr:hypothetical protein [Hymenobacter sp. M29]MDO7848064.1 hypothetical protein [Hymenobacter sp. M29]